MAERSLYRLGRLVVDSPLALPLSPAAATSPVDLTIEDRGTVRDPDRRPDAPPAAMRRERDGTIRIGLPGVASARIGTDVLSLVRAEGAAEADVAAFVIAGPLATLAARRGCLAHRMTVLERDGAALAVAGTAGVGKSTLAAALTERGFRLVSDDLSFVAPAAGGRAQAWPGVRRLALWPDSPALAGRRLDTRPIRPGVAKVAVAVPESDVVPAPLAAVALLRVSLDGGSAVRPLAAPVLARRLIDLAAQRLPIGRLGLDALVLREAALLAGSVPAFDTARAAAGADICAFTDMVCAAMERIGA